MDKTKKKIIEDSKSFTIGLTDTEEIFAMSLLCLQYGLVIMRQPEGYEIFKSRRQDYVSP
jgi:hypothetical protein